MKTSLSTEDGKRKLAEYDGEDRVVSAHELSLTFKESDHYTVNIKSGIPTLDYYVDGFRDGELITISGKTKNGKTLLAQSLSAYFSKHNSPPLWFSFEVPA
jgi:replicative DNA helicase